MGNSLYNLELEVLTPLSIGAGNENDWDIGTDCIIKDGKVYVIDQSRFADFGIDLNRLASYFLTKDKQGLIDLFGDNLPDLSKYVFDTFVKTENPIKTFQRTQLFDKPVIPGSSLKGAIRSILFTHLRKDEDRNLEDVFGSMKDGTDFMRFVRIGDIEMPNTILCNSKIFNLQNSDGRWKGGWKHGFRETNGKFKEDGFNTLYECVEPGKKGCFIISYANTAFDLSNSHENKYYIKQQQILKDDIAFLFSIINKATKAYLLKEKKFFEEYSQAERTSELIENIDWLLSLIPQDNSYCILKMSAGSGFHSITGDWQYDDYVNTGYMDGKKKYKSRKTVEYNDNLSLMGFVKLSCMSSEEKESVCEKLQKEHESIFADRKTFREEKELEKVNKQKEQEEKLRIQEQNRMKKERIEQLEDELNLLIANEEWDKAKLKADELLKLDPTSNQADDVLKMYKQHQEILARQQQEAEAIQRRLEAGLSAQLETKFEFGLNAGKFKIQSVKRCINEIENWLKKSKRQELTDQEKEDFMVTLRRLRSDCKDKKELKDWANYESGSVWPAIRKYINNESITKQFFEEK